MGWYWVLSLCFVAWVSGWIVGFQLLAVQRVVEVS